MKYRCQLASHCSEVWTVPGERATHPTEKPTMGFLDDLDLDEDDVLETLILLVVLVLVIVLAAALCCQLDKALKERRRRKGARVEEAGTFFSFHEAIPHSVPPEPGPLASLCNSTVFSLSGSKVYPGHPYTSISQTPVRIGNDSNSNIINNNNNNNNSYHPCGLSGAADGGNAPLLLDRGQHVPTPIYPPSYFAATVQPSPGVVADADAPSLPAKPPVSATGPPPPPYKR